MQNLKKRKKVTLFVNSVKRDIFRKYFYVKQNCIVLREPFK